MIHTLIRGWLVSCDETVTHLLICISVWMVCSSFASCECVIFLLSGSPWRRRGCVAQIISVRQHLLVWSPSWSIFYRLTIYNCPYYNLTVGLFCTHIYFPSVSPGGLCCFSWGSFHFFHCYVFLGGVFHYLKQGSKDRLYTDCKAPWGKFVVCVIGLYKINWHDLFFSGRKGFPYSATPTLTNMTCKHSQPNKTNRLTQLFPTSTHEEVCFHLELRKKFGCDSLPLR